MEDLLELVGLIAIVIAVSAAAKRFGLLTPIVLVIAGLALSVVPGFPTIHLEAEFVLIGILPPLLFVAALETSVPAFRFNLRPILLLAIGLVLFTAFAVGRDHTSAARLCFASNPPAQLHTAVERLGAAWRRDGT